MKVSEIKQETYEDIIEQARTCIEHEDVTGCCRVLLPVIEFYCAHYEPLPQEVVSMLTECTYIDEKHMTRERERDPRMEEMSLSTHAPGNRFF